MTEITFRDIREDALSLQWFFICALEFHLILNVLAPVWTVQEGRDPAWKSWQTSFKDFVFQSCLKEVSSLCSIFMYQAGAMYLFHGFIPGKLGLVMGYRIYLAFTHFHLASLPSPSSAPSRSGSYIDAIYRMPMETVQINLHFHPYC